MYIAPFKDTLGQSDMRCHIVKNTLLHTAFSAILPAGYLPFSSPTFSMSIFFSSPLASRESRDRDCTEKDPVVMARLKKEERNARKINTTMVSKQLIISCKRGLPSQQNCRKSSTVECFLCISHRILNAENKNKNSLLQS